MPFTLLSDYHLVRKLDPDESVSLAAIGKLVSVPASSTLQPGQVVAYNESAAKKVKRSGTEYGIIKFSEIYAVIV